MKITIKNVKYSEFASQETQCMEATVYVDGKRRFIVGNDGHGGPNNYWPLKAVSGAQHEIYALVREINETLAKEPKIDIDGTGKYMVEPDLDIVIGEQIDEWLKLRHVKKLLRKIAYINDKGEIFTVSAKFKPTDDNIAKVRSAKWWKDDYRILNGMAPEDVANYL